MNNDWNIIDFLFSALMFYIGIDYIISGILLSRRKKKSFCRPKFLGLLTLKLTQDALEKLQSNNRLFSKIFSYEYMVYHLIFLGIICLYGSLVIFFGL
jgi:hypothetical protein